MWWQDLAAAMALVFVFEGLMPFLSPTAYKRAMLSLVSMNDRTVRIIGLVSMIGGLLLLQVVR